MINNPLWSLAFWISSHSSTQYKLFTHFNIALQLWNDLRIVPYAYDDNFKSSYPTIAAKKGDGNADGKFDLADVVMTMRYLLSDDKLTDAVVCDMNLDGNLNVIDFSIMKHELLN